MKLTHINHNAGAYSTTLKYPLYKALGFLFLGLAIIGIPMPILPTTPFLLLSAWFFARSSEKWHQWLLGSELFGPLIRNWEQNRCISCRTKLGAILSMLFAGGASIVFVVQDMNIRYAAMALMVIGAVTIVRIKTCDEGSGSKPGVN